MFRIIVSIVCLFIGFLVFGQQNNEAQIDSVSNKLIQCYQENNLSILGDHFVIKDDLLFLIDSLKDKMSEEEIERAMSEIDSIPKSAKRKWQKKFDNTKDDAGEYITDWSRIAYLSSNIDIKIDEFAMRELAKVEALFEFQDHTYAINYDCIKMPRGWVLGNKLSFKVVLNEED